MAKLITDHVRNNDASFFKNFARVRENLEKFLIENKSLIGQAFANVNRDARVLRVRDMLNELIKQLSGGNEVKVEDIFSKIGLEGRIVDIRSATTSKAVSESTKAALAISAGLASAPKCPICAGLLYPKKSVSYDHKTPIRDGGKGNIENVQMTHPYCNSSKG